MYRVTHGILQYMQTFLDLLNSKNQSFKCFKAGDKSESLDYSVNVSSEIREGSSEEDLKILQQLIPENCQEIFEFYKLCNGVKLFCDEETAGVEFFKANELVAENEGWKAWFSERDENELCNFEKNGIAFGTIPKSGNYFILYEGKVYYSDHDDMNDSPIAESFNECSNNFLFTKLMQI